MNTRAGELSVSSRGLYWVRRGNPRDVYTDRMAGRHATRHLWSCGSRDEAAVAERRAIHVLEAPPNTVRMAAEAHIASRSRRLLASKKREGSSTKIAAPIIAPLNTARLYQPRHRRVTTTNKIPEMERGHHWKCEGDITGFIDNIRKHKPVIFALPARLFISPSLYQNATAAASRTAAHRSAAAPATLQATSDGGFICPFRIEEIQAADRIPS